MDIKQNRANPSDSTQTQTMVKNQRDFLVPELVIRTMQQDLEKVKGHLAPAMAPLQIKKVQEEKAKGSGVFVKTEAEKNEILRDIMASAVSGRETPLKRKEDTLEPIGSSRQKTLEERLAEVEALGDDPKAIPFLEEIAKAPQASWVIKWKAEKLLKNLKSVPAAPAPAKPQPAQSSIAQKVAPPPLALPTEKPSAPIPPAPTPTPKPEIPPVSKPEPPKFTPPFSSEPELVLKAADGMAAELKKLPESPLPPSPPPQSPSAPSEGFKEKLSNIFSNKKLLLAVALLVVGLGLISGGAWFLLKLNASPAETQTPAPSIVQSGTPVPSISATPQPVFKTDSELTITVVDNDDLAAKLKELGTTEADAASFTRVSFKNEAGKDLDLDKLLSVLKIDLFSLPIQKCEMAESCTGESTLGEQLEKDRFLFFVYSQASSNSSSTDASSSPFETKQGRVGFAVSLKEQTASSTEQLEISVRQLESLMPESLKSILVRQYDSPKIPVFEDNSYKGINIRYLNFAGSTFSIDYAIVDNKLLIATSKESMFAAIDRILKNELDF